MHSVRFQYKSIFLFLFDSDRYVFIKEIQRCCENGDFNGVYKVIIPIVGKLASDRDNSIRATLLDQFEYIARVYELL